MRLLIPQIAMLTEQDFARFFPRPRTANTHRVLADRTATRHAPRTAIARRLRALADPSESDLTPGALTPQQRLELDILPPPDYTTPASKTQQMQNDVAAMMGWEFAPDEPLDPALTHRAVTAWLGETSALLTDLYQSAYQDGRANFAEQYPDLVDETDDGSMDGAGSMDDAMRNHYGSLGKMVGEITNIAFVGQLLGWFDKNERRVDLQAAQVAWAGEQHGYREAGAGKGLIIAWELDEGAEHCDDCPDLADNSPYTDNDGDNPLPTFPGAGDTACQGNCRCSLNYVEAEPVEGAPGDDEDLTPDQAETEVEKELGIDLADFGGGSLKGGLSGAAIWLQDALSGLDREVGIALDKKGHVLAAHVGTKDSVIFQRAQIDAQRGAALSIHNHPVGQSFSPADVAFAHAMRFGEMDVYSPQWLYHLRPPGKAFDAKLGKAVIERAEQVAEETLTDLEAQAHKNFAAQLKGVFKYGQPLSWPDFWKLETQDFWHAVWSKVAPEFKLDYKRLPNPSYVAKPLATGKGIGSVPGVGYFPTKVPEDIIRENVPAAPFGALPPDFPKTLGDMANWQKVPGPSGSQQGYWVKSPTGPTYYVKPQVSIERAMNEVGTMRAYEAMGAVTGDDIPFVGAIQDASGKWYVVSQRMSEALQAQTASWWTFEGASSLPATARAEAKKLWAADALLSHYDVVGLANDNLLVTISGHPVRIEGGAGMKFRAQGAVKPNWTPAAPWDEPWTMRAKPHGAAPGSGQAGPVFGKITDAEAADLLQELAVKLTPDKLEALRQSWLAIGMPTAQAQHDIAVIEARLHIQLPKVVAELKGQALPAIEPLKEISKGYEPLSPKPVGPDATHEWAKAVVAENQPLFDAFLKTKMGYQGGAFNYTIDKATPSYKALPYKERAQIAFSNWLSQAKDGDWELMPPKVKAWFQSQPEVTVPGVKSPAPAKTTSMPSHSPDPETFIETFESWTESLDTWFQTLQGEMGGWGAAKDHLIKQVWPVFEKYDVPEAARFDALSVILGIPEGDIQEEVQVLVGWKPEPVTFSFWSDVAAQAKAEFGEADMWQKGFVAPMQDLYKSWLANSGSVTDAVGAFFAKHADAINGGLMKPTSFTSWTALGEQAKLEGVGAFDPAVLADVYKSWLVNADNVSDAVNAFFAKHTDAIHAGGLMKYPESGVSPEVKAPPAAIAWNETVLWDMAKATDLPWVSTTTPSYLWKQYAKYIADVNDPTILSHYKQWFDAETAKLAPAFAPHATGVVPGPSPKYVEADLKTSKKAGNWYVVPHEGGPAIILGHTAALSSTGALAFANTIAKWQAKGTGLFSGMKRISFNGTKSYWKADQKVLVVDKSVLGSSPEAGEAKFWQAIGLKLDAEHIEWTGELSAMAGHEVNIVQSFATYMTQTAASSSMLPTVKSWWAKKLGIEQSKPDIAPPTLAHPGLPDEPITIDDLQALWKKYASFGYDAVTQDEFADQLVAWSKGQAVEPPSVQGWLDHWAPLTLKPSQYVEALPGAAGTVAPVGPSFHAMLDAYHAINQAMEAKGLGTFTSYDDFVKHYQVWKGELAPTELETGYLADAVKAWFDAHPIPLTDLPLDLDALKAEWAKSFPVGTFEPFYESWTMGTPLPAGHLIKPDSPGGKWLQAHGIPNGAQDVGVDAKKKADVLAKWKAGPTTEPQVPESVYADLLNAGLTPDEAITEMWTNKPSWAASYPSFADWKAYMDQAIMPKVPEAWTWQNTTGTMKVDLATTAWLKGEAQIDEIAVALLPEMGSADNIADHLWEAKFNNPSAIYVQDKPTLLSAIKKALGEGEGAPAPTTATGMEAMKADAQKWTEESDPQGAKFVADHPGLWQEFKTTKMDYKGGGFNWAVQTLTSDLEKGTPAKVRQQVALARLFKLYHTEPDKLKQMVPKVYKWLGNALAGQVEDAVTWSAPTAGVVAPPAAIAAKFDSLAPGWDSRASLEQTNAWMQKNMPNSRMVYDNWKAAAGSKAPLAKWVRDILGPQYAAELAAANETGDPYYKLRGLAFTKSYLLAKAGEFDALAKISPALRDYWKDLLFPPPPMPLPSGQAPWARFVDGSAHTRNPHSDSPTVTKIEKMLVGHPEEQERWRALRNAVSSWKGGSQQVYHRAGERINQGAKALDAAMKGAKAMLETIRDASPKAPLLHRWVGHSGEKADVTWWKARVGQTLDMQLAGFSDPSGNYGSGRNVLYVVKPGSQAFAGGAVSDGFTSESEWILSGRLKVVKVEVGTGSDPVVDGQRVGAGAVSHRTTIVYLEWVTPDRTGATVLAERLKGIAL